MEPVYARYVGQVPTWTNTEKDFNVLVIKDARDIANLSIRY
jgi:hypothetical protein